MSVLKGRWLGDEGQGPSLEGAPGRWLGCKTVAIGEERKRVQTRGREDPGAGEAGAVGWLGQPEREG